MRGGGGQSHCPAALPPGMTRYPLDRRLGKPQGRSGRVRKIRLCRLTVAVCIYIFNVSVYLYTIYIKCS
jgi:hypothetical protein